MILDVPVDPDSGQARQWLIDELSKQEYLAAQPTLFDRIAKAVSDWFGSLFSHPTGGVAFPLLAVILVVVVAAVVGAYFVFGPPRLNRRSSAGVLFGVDDERDAATMRRAASAAAGAGDFTLAIEELFRAIARGLAERTLVQTSPGTTAHDFAARAGRVFPDSAAALASAADLFDGVRYLGGTGAEADYRLVERLERDLRDARPTLPAPLVGSAAR